MSVESVEELRFWQENLSGLNSSPLRQSMAAVRVDIKMAGDASAAGVFLGDFTEGNTLLSLPFTDEQMEKSSTWRELFVLYTFYCSREAEKYRGKVVLHLCDNAAVSAIIDKGSKKKELAEMAWKIFLACRELKIVLICNWESREAEIMVTADLGSRGSWMEQDEFQIGIDDYAFLHSK